MVGVRACNATAVAEMRGVDAARPVQIGFARGIVAVVEEQRLPIAGDERFHGVVSVALDGHRLWLTETEGKGGGGDEHRTTHD